jgi:hypothetical protein
MSSWKFTSSKVTADDLASGNFPTPVLFPVSTAKEYILYIVKCVEDMKANDAPYSLLPLDISEEFDWNTAGQIGCAIAFRKYNIKTNIALMRDTDTAVLIVKKQEDKDDDIDWAKFTEGLKNLF